MAVADLRDCYWIVAGDASQVFSSARAATFPVSDADYIAWLSEGFHPTSIDTYANLYDVLVTHAPEAAAEVAPSWMLEGHLSREQEFDYLNTIGVVVTSGATPALSGTYAIDAESQSRLQGRAFYIQIHSAFPNGAATMPWPDLKPGITHVFESTADFLNFATVMGDYYAALTTAELDGSEWPSNHKTIP